MIQSLAQPARQRLPAAACLDVRGPNHRPDSAHRLRAAGDQTEAACTCTAAGPSLPAHPVQRDQRRDVGQPRARVLLQGCVHVVRVLCDELPKDVRILQSAVAALACSPSKTLTNPPIMQCTWAETGHTALAAAAA